MSYEYLLFSPYEAFSSHNTPKFTFARLSLDWSSRELDLARVGEGTAFDLQHKGSFARGRGMPLRVEPIGFKRQAGTIVVARTW
jgi:hypothetical protein